MTVKISKVYNSNTTLLNKLIFLTLYGEMEEQGVMIEDDGEGDEWAQLTVEEGILGDEVLKTQFIVGISLQAEGIRLQHEGLKIYEEGLTKVKVTVTSALLETLGPVLRAQFSTWIESLSASSVVSKTPATSTFPWVGPLQLVWVKLGGQQ